MDLVKRANCAGINQIELYFPKTYVDLIEMGRVVSQESFDKKKQGTYTSDTGHHRMSSLPVFEDSVTMSLNVLDSMVRSHNIDLRQVGRLEASCEGSEKSRKSLKSHLMNYMIERGSIDIESMMV